MYTEHWDTVTLASRKAAEVSPTRLSVEFGAEKYHRALERPKLKH
jgi:hypothetical protein